MPVIYGRAIRKRIYLALKQIKRNCESCADCRDCFLYDKRIDCFLDLSPEGWDFRVVRNRLNRMYTKFNTQQTKFSTEKKDND